MLRVSDPGYAPAIQATRQPRLVCASDGWYAPDEGNDTSPRALSAEELELLEQLHPSLAQGGGKANPKVVHELLRKALA